MYRVGDKVVYPHHGAGTVVKREIREILGQKREYLTIQIAHNEQIKRQAEASSDFAGQAHRIVNILFATAADQNSAYGRGPDP